MLAPLAHPRLQLNTFQLVLATDGPRALAVFTYAEDGINRAGGAVAGYNVGDGKGYFQLPGSFSEDIQHIDSTTGNTGKEGQWLLVLDGESHNHITLYIQLYVYCMCCTSLLYCTYACVDESTQNACYHNGCNSRLAYAWAQAVVYKVIQVGYIRTYSAYCSCVMVTLPGTTIP